MSQSNRWRSTGFTRRTLLLSAGARVLSSGTAIPPNAPNIILTMTDDQGWGDVSYNGHPVLRTPNIDAMAANGVRFDRFYAAAPVCSPTRASVLTGRHPHRYRCFSFCYDLPLRAVTIAEALKPVGYATGHFGKWHLGGIPWADGGSNRGYVAEPPGPPAKTARHPGNQGFDEWFSAGNWFDLNHRHMYHNGRPADPIKGAPADVIMDHALRFIRKAAGEKRPFLAVIWFPEPHGPHLALERDRSAYHDHPGSADYFGEIAAVDRSIGRLREELRTLGIHRNTMLWFSSDNGATRDGSTGGLTGRKGSLMEGGIRVPGVLEWPERAPKPLTTNFPASTLDLYPTILEAAGIHRTPGIEPLDGMSLLPAIERKALRRAKPLCFEWCNGNEDVVASAVVDNEMKLYRGRLWEGSRPSPSGEAAEYLFNLERDAAERTDLARSQPEVVRRMRAHLETWQESVRKDAEAYPSTRSRGWAVEVNTSVPWMDREKE